MDHYGFLTRIRSLARAVSPAFDNPLSPREAWQEVKAITELFKQVCFPTKAERNDAWDEHQRTVAVLKHRQEERVQKSEELRDQIIDLAEEATPLAAWESGLVAAFVPLSGVGDAIAGDPWRREIAECQAALDKGHELLKSSKANMLREHKDAAYQALMTAGDQLQGRWEKWKDWQHEVHEQRSTEYRQRLEKEIAELETKINRLTTKCDKTAENLANNYERLDNTRNSAKREEIEQWISDDKDNLESMREKIKSWQDGIARKQEKLDHL